MQKIEYKESPSPHVIVQNFLSIPAVKECLAEAQSLEPVFEDAQLVDGMLSREESDGCEECEARRNAIVKSKRQNDVVYMDSHYRNRRYESKILTHLELAFDEDMNPSLVDTFKTFPHLFPIISQTTHMETILSSYGMCDFYGWHTDTIPGSRSARIITCVLHFHTEPKQYGGGELILRGQTLEDQLAYAPVHNTATFFQSNQCVHAVDATVHEGEFKDSRFSINLWLGFAAGNEDNPGDVVQYKYR